MPGKTKRAKLSINLMSNEPPAEFRIFKRGVNETSKGDFLFDDEAAKLVMAAYRKHGVDVMIDLEHLSLDSEGNNFDPSAYGWCRLELRNGDLWAVNVTWTKEGAERLRDRKSRYISPAFHYLTDNGRITEIYNIAICAVPATYETPALVAASKREGKQIGTLTIEVGKMDIKKILAALGLNEEATLEDVLQAIKALQDDESSEGDEGGGDGETADDPEDDKDDEEKTAAAIKDLPPKIQAKILAATAGNKVLLARLAKLEKSSKAAQVEALITANAAKLPKSLEAWARKQSPEVLADFFKDMPVVAKDPKTPPEQKGGGAGSSDNAELTKEDLKVIKLTAADPVKFLEEKKKLAKQRELDRQIAEAD